MKNYCKVAFIAITIIFSDLNLLGFSLILQNMINKQAPLFAYEDTTGILQSLSDYQGKKVLLFFFGKDYERDFENVGFRHSYNNEHLILLDRLNPWFIKNNIIVLGISDYTKDELKILAAQNTITLPLLSTVQARLTPYLYGTAHSLVGIERSIFLIDETGKISYVLQSIDPKELVVSSLIEILKNNEQKEIDIKPLLHEIPGHDIGFDVKNNIAQTLVGRKAPDFFLNDYMGNKYALSNYQGKKVLLCFFKRNIEHEIENPYETCEDLISTCECLNALKLWLTKQRIEVVTVLNYLPEDILCLKNHFDDQSILLYDSNQEVLNRYDIVMDNPFWPLKQAILLLDEQGVVRIASEVRSPFEQIYDVLRYLLKKDIQ